jgi:DNA topoisomerase VI subunit B
MPSCGVRRFVCLGKSAAYLILSSYCTFTLPSRAVSTKIPFKGTSKEYVGEDVTEIFQSVKRALQGE